MKTMTTVIICMLFLASSPVHARTDSTATTKSVFPQKRHPETVYERLLGLPGDMMSAPFWLIEQCMTPAYYLVVEKKTMAKIKDYLTSDDGLRGIFPTYEAKSGGGLNFYQKNLFSKDSRLDLTATVGLHNRQFYELNLAHIRLSGPATASFNASYRFLSDEPFYGIGNNSDKNNELSYAHEVASTAISFDYQKGTTFVAQLKTGIEQNNILESRRHEITSLTDIPLSEIPNVYGISSEVKLLNIGLNITWDTRNSAGKPTTGWLCTLHPRIYQQITDPDYRFWQISADFTKYINLFYNRTLVIRSAFQMSDPMDNRAIPFYHLSELGTRSTIRGFQRGRFRDEDMILGAIEYNYPIFNRLERRRGRESMDVVLFLDAGQVGRQIFDELNQNQLHVGYGAGIRLYNLSASIMQFLIGKSDDGYRIYFVLNK